MVWNAEQLRHNLRVMFPGRPRGEYDRLMRAEVYCYHRWLMSGCESALWRSLAVNFKRRAEEVAP